MLSTQASTAMDNRSTAKQNAMRNRQNLWLGSCMLACVSILFASPAQAQGRNNERPAACDRYDSIPAPPSDLPAADERQSLASCSSEELYFGFGAAADPVKARKCAYIEREKASMNPPKVFWGAGLLAMVYANGKGAERNFDLALKFACEVDGAPAENEGRFEHLSKLQNERWNDSDFNLCDDATSGYMMGACAALEERFDQITRQHKLDEITAKWSPADKKALVELQRAANEFFRASARNEIDLTGTGRAAFSIAAEANLNDGFIHALQRCERGDLPKFTAAQFVAADHQLNTVYARRQADPNKHEFGEVTPAGIKIAQRAWLRYRDAWVAFGKAKYPAVTAESWKTWLTQERTRMLGQEEPAYRR